jgi:hypothetical protein
MKKIVVLLGIVAAVIGVKKLLSSDEDPQITYAPPTYGAPSQN